MQLLAESQKRPPDQNFETKTSAGFSLVTVLPGRGDALSPQGPGRGLPVSLSVSPNAATPLLCLLEPMKWRSETILPSEGDGCVTVTMGTAEDGLSTGNKYRSLGLRLSSGTDSLP